AKVVGKVDASNRVILPMPLLPRSWFSYSSLTLFPSGVTAPSPVMTTRLRMKTLSSACGLAGGTTLRLTRKRGFLSHDNRRALPHVGESQLEQIRLRDPARGAGDRDGTGRVSLLVVERGRDSAVLHGQQAGGQLGRAGSGVPVADAALERPNRHAARPEYLRKRSSVRRIER